jgi:hypothetical protein
VMRRIAKTKGRLPSDSFFLGLWLRNRPDRSDTPQFVAISAVAVRHITIVESSRQSPKRWSHLGTQTEPRYRSSPMVPGVLRRYEIEIVGLGPAPESSRHQSRSIVADPASLRRQPRAPIARSTENRATNPTPPANFRPRYFGCSRGHQYWMPTRFKARS